MAISSHTVSRESSIESRTSSDTTQPLGQTGHLRELEELFARQQDTACPHGERSCSPTSQDDWLEERESLHDDASPKISIYQDTLSEDSGSTYSSQGQENRPPESLGPTLSDVGSIPYTLKLSLLGQVFEYEGKISPSNRDRSEQGRATLGSTGYAELDGIELRWNVCFIKELPQQSTPTVLGCINRFSGCYKPARPSEIHQIPRLAEKSPGRKKIDTAMQRKGKQLRIC